MRLPTFYISKPKLENIIRAYADLVHTAIGLACITLLAFASGCLAYLLFKVTWSLLMTGLKAIGPI